MDFPLSLQPADLWQEDKVECGYHKQIFLGLLASEGRVTEGVQRGPICPGHIGQLHLQCKVLKCPFGKAASQLPLI